MSGVGTIRRASASTEPELPRDAACTAPSPSTSSTTGDDASDVSGNDPGKAAADDVPRTAAAPCGEVAGPRQPHAPGQDGASHGRGTLGQGWGRPPEHTAIGPCRLEPPPAADRPDPVALLEEQNRTTGSRPVAGPPRPDDRLAVHLLPGDGHDDHGRRPGAPPRPRGCEVQLCGDAHLSNFGRLRLARTAPRLRPHDFDETLPGPFEYDVERMAASFDGGSPLKVSPRRRSGRPHSCRTSRAAMASFAASGTMDLWYAKLSEDRSAGRIADVRGPARPSPADREGGQEGHPASRLEEDSKQRMPKVEGRPSRQGTDPGQLAGPVQAGRARRRAVPDRQRATGPGARARARRHYHLSGDELEP